MINAARTDKENLKKAASRLWKTADQKPYLLAAALDLEKYEKAMQAYIAAHPKKTKRKADDMASKKVKKPRSAQAYEESHTESILQR